MRTTSLPTTIRSLLTAVLCASAGCGVSPTPAPPQEEDSTMDIEITASSQEFRATLTESAAARDLLAQLAGPVTARVRAS